MDLLIQNGDFVIDDAGQPAAVYGIDEAVQRAAIVLSTVKGDFKYDRELGADVSSITKNSSREQIILICREALQGREDIELTDAEIIQRGNNYYLRFEIEWNGQRGSGEVLAAGMRLQASSVRLYR